MIPAALFDRARSRIARVGFDSDTQTGIALFLGATKSLNAALLAPAEWMPANTTAYPFMHGQYFRECEFGMLLARVTQWSTNPFVYSQAAALAGPLGREWLHIQLPPGPLYDGVAAYRALAFGHALLARVRFAPVLPANADASDPFVIALRRIEQENGRMLQAQIRLLKDSPVDLPVAERERIVEQEQAVVDGAFTGFLEWLAEGATASASLPLPPFWMPGPDFWKGA
jgi:hypothetical protein